MGTPGAVDIVDRPRRLRLWLGYMLLGAGLLGHLLAARAIGGSSLAYRHHILGFVLLTVVSGAIIVLLGWRFWRRRPDITVLAIGIVQALVGLMVYVGRFGVHG